VKFALDNWQFKVMTEGLDRDSILTEYRPYWCARKFMASLAMGYSSRLQIHWQLILLKHTCNCSL